MEPGLGAISSRNHSQFSNLKSADRFKNLGGPSFEDMKPPLMQLKCTNLTCVEEFIAAVPRFGDNFTILYVSSSHFSVTSTG